MTTITTVQSETDLLGILALQQANLRRTLPADVAATQGFVTLQYTLDQMRQMHQAGPSLIAKDGDTVVGYVITTLPETRQFVPELGSLFDQIDALTYQNRPLPTYAYYVAGQVCVANGYRGQALLDRMYQHHRAIYADRFQLLITDISALNTRSLRVHERIGFQSLQRFYEPTAGEEWVVVVWDWQK
jgi:hypothetical protein